MVIGSGYGPRGPGFDSQCIQIIWEAVGLERDEALKERVQSSLSQHTQACSLDVPREPWRCGNNEFYFVSPQLSSTSVHRGYSGIREEEDFWNGPLETGHSQNPDEDGRCRLVFGIAPHLRRFTLLPDEFR
uniref:Uncharacterized protein n=1 Tax=Timema shepardi TaxID=629360 RepID=A0A7R9B0X2_TIMSH|nr:unnamed protein product [Timema shepardi]